jgi:hypothetical protein
MNYFQRRRILKSVSAMDLIPIRIHGHDVVEGKVVILAPKFKSPIVHALFPRTAQLFYRIKLDELGSLTWGNISGDKTVGEITLSVQEQLGDKAQSFEEAEIRVSKFMSMLYDWRYITFGQILNHRESINHKNHS